MGWLGKSKPTGDIIEEDEILGYLDECIAQRCILHIQIGKNIIPANIYFINDKDGLIRIQDNADIIKFHEKKVIVGFTLDYVWFQFETSIIVHHDKPNLEIPVAINHVERRKVLRTRLSVREAADVSIVESMGKGVGVSGTAVDIGCGGMALFINHAVLLDTEKNIKICDTLYKKGQKLMIVRIKGLPKIPVIDVSAEVNRITKETKFKLAIEFTSMDESFRGAIQRFCQERHSPFRIIPRSRKRRLEIEKERLKQKEEKKQFENLDNGKEDQAEEITVQDNKFIGEITSETVSSSMNKSNDVVNQTPKNGNEKLDLKQVDYTVYSFGDGLCDHLQSICQTNEFSWVHCETPLEISKYLREEKIKLLIIGINYNQKNIFGFLEKLYKLELLKNISILLLTDVSINSENVDVYKTVGVKEVISLPIDNLSLFIERIRLAKQIYVNSLQ
jgi:c-di-GMP-binding flagellar brake protein YcgR